MRILSMNLKNCYGIKSLDFNFDFSKKGAYAIYARNGLMKTSLAKTLKKVQTGKDDEIRDEIFNEKGNVDIKIDGEKIESQKVFVIDSFEEKYQSDVTNLLVDYETKKQIKDILDIRDKLFKQLEKFSGVKVKKTYLGKTTYELEDTIIKDFSLKQNSFLMNLKVFADYKEIEQPFDIAYNEIFDNSIQKNILKESFQSKIRDFLKKSNEIYDEYKFLKKGYLTLPKLKNIYKSLDEDKYFINNNKLLLNGTDLIENESILKNKIDGIEKQLKDIKEFKDINKFFNNTKGVRLNDILELNPDIIEWLSEEKLPELKKILWKSYIKKSSNIFEELYEKYEILLKKISNISIDETPWKRALNIYKKRFTVPYDMKISNLTSSIIGESIPKIEFLFKNDNKEVNLNRDVLEDLKILSQGEKRALYLLNIIFDIEQIKQNNLETLFIIDDIADSFDYKNKYAIIEYLYELLNESNFYLIILSHNFDFYRTVCSRLGINGEHRLFAYSQKGNISLEKEKYQKQPFEAWKKNLSTKNIIALVPFVRNLTDYGRDCTINKLNLSDKDYLTNLLHEKEYTNNILISNLEPLYKEYLGIDKFTLDSKYLNIKVIDELYNICERITINDVELENKILLAMAIRHKAEVFMIKEIMNYKYDLYNCRRGRKKLIEDKSNFIKSITGVQTRTLLDVYKQFGDIEHIKLLEAVNIMTPENIHLNAFMYEPILDMDIIELINLYKSVKRLINKNCI